MNIIYVYTTETYRSFRNWRKVGMTKQESAEVRVSQQDGTSNPEPLIIEKVFEVDDWISDHTIHAELVKMGKMRVRMDKDREWFECSVEDVATAINSIKYGVSRPHSWDLRPEQQECVNKCVTHFKNGGTKFLINAKMRYGKTSTSYDIIRDYGAKRCLVLTYKPSVDASWREDLETHVKYEGWKYYSAKEDFSNENPITLSEDNELFEFDGYDVEIIFGSFQDANEFTKAKWKKALEYHYDIIVIDEMHYGSNTERAKQTLSQFNYDKVLYVSGTPLKALLSGEFLDEEIYTWGYADEQEKRKAEKDNNWETEVYRWLPVMNFLTYEVSEEAKQLTKCYTDDEGFTMTKMFGSEDGETFVDESAVKLFLDQVFGIGVRKTKSPVRTKAVDHMLWVLPPNVASATAMSNMLKQRVGNEYEIINVAGDNVRSLTKVKQLIERNEKTITVTCGRFNTGVTVREWDMIVMLDDTRAPETYFQTIFRGGSPDSKRQKEEFFVVDFNPQRCLEMIYEYADIVAKKDQSTQDAVREFIEFAPILDHSGNTPVQVDAAVVLNLMAETGGYAERFGSTHMFNWSKLDDFADKFYGIDAESQNKNTSTIGTSDLERGKNYTSNSVKTKKQIDEERKAEKEKRLRVQTAFRRLPTYLFLEEEKIDSVEDILYTNNTELFQDTIGLTIEDFRDICSGLIKTDRLNRCIMAYNQIEWM